MDKKILIKNLDLLVGQDQAKHLISKCLEAGSCSAYLLVGPPHVGKGFLARLMAASLHNEANVYKIHSDTVIFDDILAKNSGEDDENKWKQSVDDFIHAIYLSPVQSSKKIGIIENIDRFSSQALNALLKTLEEPPARAILILTAQEITNVLPTILSRAQVVRLHYLSDADIEQYLTTQQASKIPEITLLANGAVGMANQLMHDPKLLNQAWEGITSFQTILQKDIAQMLQTANVTERDDAIDLVQIWLNLARRALLGKLGPGNALADSMQNYSQADLLKLIDRLKLALFSLEANANVRITLEATMLSVI